MPQRHPSAKWLGLLVLGLVSRGDPAVAQILGSGVTPVTEIGGQLVQSTITAANSVTTALNVAASYVRQGEQLINEYNIIRQQIAQYETMVRNLQRLPQGLNFFDTVLTYGNQLTGVLAQANALTYDANRSVGDFQRLYGDAKTVALGDLRPVLERYRTARLEASQVAVQMQSMRTNISDLFAKLCALLDGSWQAQGNLDSAQLAAQQQALSTTTLQQIQALLMTSQRLAAQREAEETALAELRQRVQDELARPLPAYTGQAGVVPRWQ